MQHLTTYMQLVSILSILQRVKFATLKHIKTR